MEIRTEEQLISLVTNLSKIYNLQERGVKMAMVWDEKPPPLPHWTKLLGYTLEANWDGQWIIITNMCLPFKAWVRASNPKVHYTWTVCTNPFGTRELNDRRLPRRWNCQLFKDNPLDLEIREQKKTLERFNFILR